MANTNFPDVLMIAPDVNANDVGEAFVAYKWAHELSQHCRLTLLALERPDQPPIRFSLPHAEVVTWPMPKRFARKSRFNSMFKPYYPYFARKVRQFADDAFAKGRMWDLAHQLMPLAARYPSPLRHLGLPYIIGPIGGTIKTPKAFEHEITGAPLFTKLRQLDHLRFKYDPFLRSSYRHASMVLGVASYVRDHIQSMGVQNFVPMLELGVDDVPAPIFREAKAGTLKMLHVGRAVRTKGLRDVIRAMSYLRDYPEITLTSAGDGEDLEVCRQLATDLGVADRVAFLGQVPRSKVEELYQTHDAFVFPSFREPTGNVLFEAMRWGLPIITANAGGPAEIVNSRCSFLIEPTEPEQYARDVAMAVRQLADEPDLRLDMGAEARAIIAAEGRWDAKIETLLGHYQSILHWEWHSQFGGQKHVAPV